MSRAREEALPLRRLPRCSSSARNTRPRQPSSASRLDHVREAIERDGAQIAASDEALRAPLPRLASRSWLSGARSSNQAAVGRAGRHGVPRGRRAALTRRGGGAGDGRVGARRPRRLVIAADRAAPPAYITNALGEKPTESESLRRWERGVEADRASPPDPRDQGPQQRLLGSEPSERLCSAPAGSEARTGFRPGQRALGGSYEAASSATSASSASGMERIPELRVVRGNPSGRHRLDVGRPILARQSRAVGRPMDAQPKPRESVGRERNAELLSEVLARVRASAATARPASTPSCPRTQKMPCSPPTCASSSATAATASRSPGSTPPSSARPGRFGARPRGGGS